MKKFNPIFGLLLFISMLSCNSESKQKSEEIMSFREEAPALQRAVKFAAPMVANETVMLKSADSGADPVQNATSASPKKIIKDGRISIKTNDIAAGKKTIDGMAKQFNAYYDNEEMQNDERTTSYDLKLRIPAENFENLIAALENGKDEITNKSIHTRDVTAEYVDIETRLSNKREYLKRYRELLAKALTVKDILEIEENIRKLLEEIESREQQLKYLSGQVAFSTLDINLFKVKEFVYKPPQPDKFSERIKNSLSKGWTSIVTFILWIIGIWPYLLLISLVYVLYNRLHKKRKAAK